MQQRDENWERGLLAWNSQCNALVRTSLMHNQNISVPTPSNKARGDAQKHRGRIKALYPAAPRTFGLVLFGVGLGCSALLAGTSFIVGSAFSRENADKTQGPNACVECHKSEGTVWKKTHHFSTFRDMPRAKAAREIARKMKIKRMKASELCLGCHFTSRNVKKKTKAIAGISCESCHGAGRDYIKAHAEFSGKKNKDSESKSEAAARWANSEAAGMIRPKALYRLAKNCFGCHVVPREELVNIGGHPAGSPFELYSWSQGEVRHNVWYSKGKQNTTADANRARLMFVVGLAVELETSLRAIGAAKRKKAYAVRMALRADGARKKLAVVAKALPNVPEIAAIVRLGYSAGLKLENKKSLIASADGVSKEARRFLANHDGRNLGAIDSLIPGPDKFRGAPAN